MRQLRALLHVYRLNGWRNFLASLGTRRKALAITMLVLMLLGAGPFVGTLTSSYYAVYQLGAQHGQGELVLTLAMLAGMAAMLFFGFFQLISTFYYSKDSNLLVPMPIPARTILIAKFIGVMVVEYLTLLVLVGPALVIYGAQAGPGALYWPKALLIFLLLPVLPLVVAALFAFVLMRVTNLRRSRDLFRMIGGAIGLFLAISINRLMNQGMRDPSALINAVAMPGGLVDLVGQRVPPVIWATRALAASAGAGSQALNLVLFLLAVGVGFGLLAWAGELLFWGGLIGSGEGQRRDPKASAAALQRSGAERSALQALLSREAKLLLRTPVFVLNSVIPLVVLPFAMAPAVGQLKAALGQGALQQNPRLVGLAAVAILCFLNAAGNIAATAVSREGPYIWISQTAPVPPRTHALAKLLFANLFALLPMALIAGVGFYAGLWHGGSLVGFILVGLLAVTALNAAALTIDLIRPLLKWEDPQRAIKQNVNGLFGLLIGVLGAAITGGVGLVINLVVPGLLFPLLGLLYAGLAAGLVTLCLQTADARWGHYGD
jgi:ABC-2 type transport system permease protein